MIPDEDFYKVPEVPGPSKEEVRCLVMCHSRVKEGDVVLEVGCGTGGLTVELSRRAAKVYSVDKNPQALEVTLTNLRKLNPQGEVELILGDALEAMEDLPPYDLLVVGGSSGELEEIIRKAYQQLQAGGRVVITAILLETRLRSLKVMEDLEMEPRIVEVFVARGRTTQMGTMMQGLNPVAIISGVKKL
ncbi:MAG: precorrin-6Y C5,15-methyltransferase (decarboxylating) subunit CbiT [Euryarchaeota archaeon]|jgi:cobalt-precorrin-6B (C15)-methyltransferase|nr:precorrin-6Y C5,15-methyltransferase (decarboxylating) subunit CbiT [Euryarchaeota archaeon]